MSFDQNKANLLQQLQKQKQDQIMRQRGLEAQNRLKEKTRLAEAEAERATGAISVAGKREPEQTNKPPVAIFGVKSLFTSTLKNLLQQYCEVHEFEEVNKASDFLRSNYVPIALMDMDPPNDCGACNDFFAAGKAINQDLQYIIYQKEDKLPEAVETLQKQGAFVLHKPIDRMELIDLIRKFTIKWREKNVERT